jgi:hypothetical protein
MTPLSLYLAFSAIVSIEGIVCEIGTTGMELGGIVGMGVGAGGATTGWLPLSTVCLITGSSEGCKSDISTN